MNRFAITTVICLMAAAGCDKKPAADRPPRQSTHGTVTYNGKPPKGATVILWPVPVENVDWRTVKPAAKVGPDGSYKITTYELNDGTPVGEYAVTVLWTGENDDFPVPDIFKGRYSDPKRPVLKVTIKEGDNPIPPIVLTGPTPNAADLVPPPGTPGN